MPKQRDEGRNHDEAAADAEQARGDADDESERDEPRIVQHVELEQPVAAHGHDEQHADRDGDEQRDEHPAQPAEREAAQEPRPDPGADDAADRDEERGEQVDLAVREVGDRPDDRRGHDRGQRGGRGAALVHAGERDEQRHHEDAAADAERARQQPPDQPDEREPHPRRRARAASGGAEVTRQL